MDLPKKSDRMQEDYCVTHLIQLIESKQYAKEGLSVNWVASAPRISPKLNRPSKTYIQQQI